MPMLRPETLAALAASSFRSGAVTALEAEDGHLQFLGAAWPLGRLREALAAIEHPGGGWADLSLRRLYAQLAEEELATLPATGAEGADIDTPDALAQVRRVAGPRIALAQLQISEDVASTFETVRAAVGEAAGEGAHLVLLPEATLTPFGTDLRAAALAHHEDFAQLVQELAEEHGVVVVAGSFTPTDDGRVHNTVIVRGPNWDPPLPDPKIHLFAAFGTDQSRTVALGDALRPPATTWSPSTWQVPDSASRPATTSASRSSSPRSPGAAPRRSWSHWPGRRGRANASSSSCCCAPGRWTPPPSSSPPTSRPR